MHTCWHVHIPCMCKRGHKHANAHNAHIFTPVQIYTNKHPYEHTHECMSTHSYPRQHKPRHRPAHAYTYTGTHVHRCIDAYIMHAHMCAQREAHLSTHMHEYIHPQVHNTVHTCAHTRIYTYTHQAALLTKLRLLIPSSPGRHRIGDGTVLDSSCFFSPSSRQEFQLNWGETLNRTLFCLFDLVLDITFNV